MELIRVTKENLENEHICCAISNNKDVQVVSKKTWLSERFDEGLVFLKGNVRGKCFIEYIPAEFAWAPIEADGYMYVNCLWVSGQFKGHGYSNLLLEECIRDSREKGKKGLVMLSSAKKKGFLADKKYLQYKGFRVADKSEPYFELLFDEESEKPRFVNNRVEDRDGLVLYYTNQCPFTAKYVPMLEKIANDRGVAMKTVHIETLEQAKKSPCPFTTFSLYFNGEFITHEIQSEKKFEKIIDDLEDSECLGSTSAACFLLL